MLDLTAIAWTVVAFCALLVGFTKTGLPMAGIVVVPLLAVVMDAQLSVGFLLGLLCLADVMAAFYWRHHAEWDKLMRLMPATILGILVGYICHRQIRLSDGDA